MSVAMTGTPHPVAGLSGVVLTNVYSPLRRTGLRRDHAFDQERGLAVVIKPFAGLAEHVCAPPAGFVVVETDSNQGPLRAGHVGVVARAVDPRFMKPFGSLLGGQGVVAVPDDVLAVGATTMSETSLAHCE